MKIIYNRVIPPGRRFHAINLFGVLFAKGPCGPVTINHERIHTAQIRELAYIGFYLWYLVEWIVRMVQYRGRWMQAYANISFEREAYANQRDMAYLSRRRPYAFRRFI